MNQASKIITAILVVIGFLFTTVMSFLLAKKSSDNNNLESEIKETKIDDIEKSSELSVEKSSLSDVVAAENDELRNRK